VYGQLGVSFSRLYLAGGVTTMRTAGNVNGIMDINVSRRISSGELAGPAIDATAPYVNGPSSFLQMHALNSAEEARKHVAYWAEQGATSLKAYMQISRVGLKAAIDEGHRRGMKITGHLCSVTYSEAADLIDFNPSTVFCVNRFCRTRSRTSGVPGGASRRSLRSSERRSVQGASAEGRTSASLDPRR
jgi:enamidase